MVAVRKNRSDGAAANRNGRANLLVRPGGAATPPYQPQRG